MSRKVFRLLFLLMLHASLAVAQDNIHIRTHSYGSYWEFPLAMDHVNYFDFNDDQSRLHANVQGGVVVPFRSSEVDTITFQGAPTSFTENRYNVFQMYITINSGEAVTSKEE